MYGFRLLEIDADYSESSCIQWTIERKDPITMSLLSGWKFKRAGRNGVQVLVRARVFLVKV